MKNLLSLSMMIILLSGLGGCGLPAADKPPNTHAFNDHFTRGFMDSPKEVEDGYYLFRSKTNGYTMLFPVEGEMSDMSYEREKDHFELLDFGESLEGKNISYNIQVIFENSAINQSLSGNLELLSGSIDYDGEYDQFKHNGKTFYYGERVHEIQGENNDVYNYFSFIKSEYTDKGIQFIGSSTCTDRSKPCKAESNEVKEIIMKIMKSIEFQDE
ncbi:MAG TPA: hypothetical protein VIG80_12270 [Bacillaceae bacterium]